MHNKKVREQPSVRGEIFSTSFAICFILMTCYEKTSYPALPGKTRYQQSGTKLGNCCAYNHIIFYIQQLPLQGPMGDSEDYIYFEKHFCEHLTKLYVENKYM